MIIEEFLKSSADPVYFIENYITIIDRDCGKKKFILSPQQKYLIYNYHNNDKTITKAPRQFGKTSLGAAYILWFSLFKNHQTSAIVTHREEAGKEVIDRIILMIDYLPEWMQPKFIRKTKSYIEFENGSRIISSGISSRSLIGRAINLIFFDEYAWIKTSAQLEFMNRFIPVLIGSKIIISSTQSPNHDSFYMIWTSDKTFKKLEVTNESPH